MTDIKLLNGDLSADSSGALNRLSDTEARFQRAVIRMSAKKGAFIYDRELGSSLREDELSGAYAEQYAELAFNSALSRLDGTSARVLETGEKIRVKITVDGLSKTEEVRLYGYLQ